MSVALDYADETVRRLLPDDRLKLLHKLSRYCFKCGRVGLKQQLSLGWSCAYCDRVWTRKDWGGFIEP